MYTKAIQLHKLLERQLSHAHLVENECPNSIENWRDFLSRVNNFYIETDEERYMLERSMELSSKEILELNNKLENAQEIAELGYWHFDAVTGKLMWSKELRKICGLTPADSLPNYTQFLESIHPDYRNKLDKAIQNSINTGERYEMELQVRIADGTYHWHYAVGAPFQGTKPPYTKLAGIAMDITKRKKAEEKMQELNTQIIASAREVGMADVAVSILHNVGNVLNSVNVSSNLLVENLQKSHFNRFFDVCKMLREHAADIFNYLTVDEKGRLIPEYIMALGDSMQENYNISCAEIANINEKIQHIRDIVMAQQSLSRVNGIFEKVNLKDVMKTTIMMLGSQLSEKNIELQEEYSDVPEIYVDRAKLVQILVNIVQNAKDAILEDVTQKSKKFIKVIIKLSDNEPDKIILRVEDNGIGISAENIKKLFGYGFSTKSNGHGIGLHSSVLTANEIGGKISVTSDGIGQGAQFTLELPATEKAEETHSAEK